MNDPENASFFDRLRTGLEDSIAYSRGQINLRTTKLPAPPPPASAKSVAALRKRLGMSQAVFAAMLNVSPKLVQGWEQGLRRPDGGALRLMQLIRTRPEIIEPLLVPAHLNTRIARKSTSQAAA